MTNQKTIFILSILGVIFFLIYLPTCGLWIPQHPICSSNGIGNVIGAIVGAFFTYLIVIGVEDWKRIEEETEKVTKEIVRIISEYHSVGHLNNIGAKDLRKEKTEELFWYLNYVGFLYKGGEVNQTKLLSFLNKYKMQINSILSSRLKNVKEIDDWDLYIFVQEGILELPRPDRESQ